MMMRGRKKDDVIYEKDDQPDHCPQYFCCKFKRVEDDGEDDKDDVCNDHKDDDDDLNAAIKL